MPHFRLVLLFIVALSLCVNAAPPPADQIFPDSTKGFFAIRNLEEFAEQWSKTQLGQLMNDPLMDDFKNEVRKQLSERMEITFSISFDDISSLPSGEIAVGMITIPGQIPGYVLTMDVAGKRVETTEYLATLTQKFATGGVRTATETYREQTITVLTFPQPAEPLVPRGTKEDVPTPIEHRVYYMSIQDVLIVSDQSYLLRLFADRIADQNTAQPLAKVESYQVVMNRCTGDMPDGVLPIIHWYIEPLDYGEATRTVLQNRSPVAQNRRDRPSIFTVLKQQGFDAIGGIGGVISMKVEEQETVYRTFIHTQKPYRLAMRMLDFPNHSNFAPPTWMPSDLARCTILSVDPLAIFDNFGVLFDAVIMPGEEGVWQDIVDGLKNDPHGPKIDVREELIVNLGSRILGMSRYEKPITIDSESIVFAVELKSGQEAAMLAGIEKLFGTDPEMQATEYKLYKIWHRRPAEGFVEPDYEILDIFNDKPSGSGNTAPPAVPQQANDAPADRDPMFPEGGIVVAKNCLFISTNIEYLKVTLDRLDAEIKSSIGDEAEYKMVNQIFANMGLMDKPHFFQFFARTHETLRPTYEMVRLDRMAQSQTLFAKLLNEVLSQQEETGIRRQIIDGSTLPEFDKVQHYFGTAGIYGVSEDDGYFIKGFTQERE